MKGGVVKALIIEGDPAIEESISLAFQIRWPEAQVIATQMGRKGIDLAKSETPDIIILDLELPDTDGFEVLEQIRLFSSIPIIVLTVKSDEADLVRALERGADDYIIKPCGQLELLARVQARMRDRAIISEESPLSFGPLHFDPSMRRLEYGKREIELTAVEAHITHRLMKNRGRLATYSSLIQDAWGEDFPGSVEALRVHIRRLREKIEADPGAPQLVLTEPGKGYFLAGAD